jgi:hypothetical protein
MRGTAGSHQLDFKIATIHFEYEDNTIWLVSEHLWFALADGFGSAADS